MLDIETCKKIKSKKLILKVSFSLKALLEKIVIMLSLVFKSYFKLQPIPNYLLIKVKGLTKKREEKAVKQDQILFLTMRNIVR
ncbi:hypothetical protein AB3G33_15845 [Flavobacterium sp. WC2421]|uniref:Uncharacterized protein n=2 Tax=unclassified Flavobacterium TaxID=196869 RepID=A0AB39WFD3_9FLAO